ncbi:type II secretion system F family protein [Micrococcus sp.]|uniref:type II secretion system F family protein n=1 Tax=Micrococcus sp. TaxID=1271 RepID=UPI002A9092D5|nr:type II secretion system F family protein [Micrococcus sp.]MDY6055088.1 type II secretion system F family protein [Micrococcus sp.]
MPVLLGLTLGAGLLLIWWSAWAEPAAAGRTPVHESRLRALIARAGISRLTPAGVLSAMAVGALVTGVLVLAVTRTWAIAGCFALFGAAVPILLLNWQANRRSVALRELWPDAIDHVRSAVRAGLTLPEALIQLGESGPEGLREPFREFARDYRSGASLGTALDRLKVRMADPVADRLVVSLRLTREVGGADIGVLLQTLAEFLRQDARIRSELEARQSWTVNAARLAVCAPWIVLLLLGTQPSAVAAYQSPAGVAVLAGGLAVSVLCYRVMLRIGALPREKRVFA